MLTLKTNLGYGSLADFSLKINLLLDKEATLEAIKKYNIELDEEAIEFIKSYYHNQFWTDPGNLEFDFKGPDYVDINGFQEINGKKKNLKSLLPFNFKKGTEKVYTASVQQFVNKAS